MSERIWTASFAALLFVGALFFSPNLFWLVIVITGFSVCVQEWLKLSGYLLTHPNLFFSLIFIVSLGLAFFIRHSKLEHWRWLIYLDVLFWIFLAPIWIARGVLLRRWVKACIGITLLLPFSISLVLLRDLSPWILLRYMAVFWVSDTFAYFSGRILGHHKLAPQTSPGKTWEGVAGGMIAVTIYAIIVTPQFLVNFQFYGMLAMAVIGIIGDLFESMIKRQAGVKDSGRLLPGHGGILDRLDSQIAALPLALLLIR